MQRVPHLLFIASLLGLTLFWIIRTPLAMDLDLYLHIVSGERISTLHKIVRPDEFTYTSNGAPEEVHSWLSQWLFFQWDKAFGVESFKLLHFLTMIGIYWILFLSLAAPNGILAAFAFLAIQTAIPVFRPLMLGQVCFLVFTLKLLPRQSWWGLGLVALWGNLHGSVVLVVPIILIWWLAGGWKDRDRKQTALFSLLTILATLANPTNITLFSQAAELAAIGREEAILEWLPRLPVYLIKKNDWQNWLHISTRPEDLVWLGAVCLTFWNLWHRRSSRHETILTFIFLALPLWSVRNFAYLIFPACLAIRHVTKRAIAGSTLLCTICAFAVFQVNLAHPFQEVKELAQKLKASGFKGNILNYPPWGSYLIYIGYPDWRVSADLRLSVNQEYFRFVQEVEKNSGPGLLDPLLKRYPEADAVMFPPEAIQYGIFRELFTPFAESDGVAIWIRKKKP